MCSLHIHMNKYSNARLNSMVKIRRRIFWLVSETERFCLMQQISNTRKVNWVETEQALVHMSFFCFLCFFHKYVRAVKQVKYRSKTSVRDFETGFPNYLIVDNKVDSFLRLLKTILSDLAVYQTLILFILELKQNQQYRACFEKRAGHVVIKLLMATRFKIK